MIHSIYYDTIIQLAYKKNYRYLFGLSIKYKDHYLMCFISYNYKWYLYHWYSEKKIRFNAFWNFSYRDWPQGCPKSFDKLDLLCIIKFCHLYYILCNVCNSNNYDSELNRVVYQNLSTQVGKSNSTEWLILYIFVH